MAIKPANSNYHTFTFNGVRAADYGIYVTDVNVFNSAARDVEYIQIPGRDGAFALDRGRFQNISVVYKCAMTQDTDEDFATAISEFRNAIASTKGYKRLEDDIHTDEYRMGVFSKGLEAPTLNTKTATFDVEFNCQPQRFLKSGDTAVTIGGDVTNTKTESGSIISIESDGGDAVTSLVAQIEPVQAGSGDPSPTNVRAITGWTACNVNVAGKNLITVTARTQTTNGVTFTFNDDGFVLVSAPSAVSGGAELNFKYSTGVRYLPVGVPLTVSGGREGVEVRACYNNGSGTKVAGTSDGGDVTFTIPDNAGTTWARVRVQQGFQGEALIYPMVRVASDTDATWKPIKGNTYPVSFGDAGTVYGGTLDVVTGAVYGGTVGVLTVTKLWYVVKSTDSLTYDSTSQSLRRTGLTGNHKNNTSFICSHFRRYTGGFANITNLSAMCSGRTAAFKDTSLTSLSAWKTWLDSQESAGKPLQFVAELETPQTYSLTAQQVELLTGDNNVWADTGDITITWGDDPNKLVNPTLYDSHPLLHVWGYGDIGIGGDTLSINNDEYGRTLLANRLSKSATSVSSYLDESAVLMLNSGDDVFVSAGSSVVFPLTFRGSASINIISATIANSSPYDFPMESSVSNFGNYVTVSVSLPQLDFIFNQTLQHLRSNIRVTINYTEAGVSKTSTAECQIHAQYSLTPLGRYRVALFYYDVAVDKFHNPSTAVMTIQPIYGVSTQRPFSDDADFYFDLDIGEAYKIEDGQIISVNNAVTIPAQLPTLKSGANTIAYDDTITQFKVVPRWWEV